MFYVLSFKFYRSCNRGITCYNHVINFVSKRQDSNIICSPKLSRQSKWADMEYKINPRTEHLSPFWHFLTPLHMKMMINHQKRWRNASTLYTHCFTSTLCSNLSYALLYSCTSRSRILLDNRPSISTARNLLKSHSLRTDSATPSSVSQNTTSHSGVRHDK